MRHVFGLLAATLLLAPGCGDDGNHQHADADVDCTTESRAEPYSAGMTRVGTTGIKVVLVESDPAPPHRGDNAWTLRILDTDDQPMDGLTVTMDPNDDILMVDHGHGTSKPPVITPQGSDGVYVVDPINTWMPGYWEITPHISDGAGLTDKVTFNICIED